MALRIPLRNEFNGILAASLGLVKKNAYHCSLNGQPWMETISSISGIRQNTISQTVLLILLIITIFAVSALPETYYNFTYRLMLSSILVAVSFSIESFNRNFFRITTGALLALFIIASFTTSKAIDLISHFLNNLFFIVAVILLLIQVARSKQVSSVIVVEAINGYLLMGLLFSFLLKVFMNISPKSFNVSDSDIGFQFSKFYNHLYFGFITMGTIGFGDIVPKTPFAKSFTTLIGVSGQLYIATIIALIVGKHGSRMTGNS